MCVSCLNEIFAVLIYVLIFLVLISILINTGKKCPFRGSVLNKCIFHIRLYLCLLIYISFLKSLSVFLLKFPFYFMSFKQYFMMFKQDICCFD